MMATRILIVDDSEKNLKLCELLVSSLGYETITASNGKDGISLAAEKMPNLILMDIKMPGMDGTATLKALKSDEKTRDIPVIAVTAYAMKNDRQRLLDYGFSEYVAKPVKKSEFIEVLQKTLQK